MERTVYIAGKITGDVNYKQKFKAAKRALKKAGYIPLSPAMLPEDGFSYEAYMRISAAMQAECQCVCLLHDWASSPGARMEFKNACENGQTVILLENVLQEGESYATSTP